MKIDLQTVATIIVLGCLIVITLAIGHLAWGWL